MEGALLFSARQTRNPYRFVQSSHRTEQSAKEKRIGTIVYRRYRQGRPLEREGPGWRTRIWEDRRTEKESGESQ